MQGHVGASRKVMLIVVSLQLSEAKKDFMEIVNKRMEYFGA